jgi:hypothetical protein
MNVSTDEFWLEPTIANSVIGSFSKKGGMDDPAPSYRASRPRKGMHVVAGTPR